MAQAEFPRHTLKDALRVPFVLSDSYGKQPTRPLRVAEALNMSPTSSTFRMLTSASEAYGLTLGAAQAEQIGLTLLGRRVVAPTRDGDDLLAKREAFLKPTQIRTFLQKYDGSRLPDNAIAMNVLEEMGVPRSAVARAIELVTSGAKDLGLVRPGKGGTYVDLEGMPLAEMPSSEDGDEGERTDEHREPLDLGADEKEPGPESLLPPPSARTGRSTSRTAATRRSSSSSKSS